jgi:hypothetical protein
MNSLSRESGVVRVFLGETLRTRTLSLEILFFRNLRGSILYLGYVLGEDYRLSCRMGYSSVSRTWKVRVSSTEKLEKVTVLSPDFGSGLVLNDFLEVIMLSFLL